MNARLAALLSSRTAQAIAWLVLVAIGFALLASALDPALSWPMFGAEAKSWDVVAINILPFVLIVLALLTLTRRPVLSAWIGTLLLVATYSANAIKVEQLEMPLLPGDFQFLAELGATLPLFAHYIGTNLVPVLIGVALLVMTIAMYRESPLPALRGWRRLVLALPVAVLGVGLLQGWGPWRQVYCAERLHFEPWSVVDSAKRAGMVGNLVLYNWELARRQELKPDREAAQALLREHADALRTRMNPNSSPLAMPADTLPDIVIVQSESLFNPERLTGAPKNTYLPNFRRLAKRGLSGEMVVPTFAGGTIRTEFEVLTGLALEFFPGVQYPYFEIADQPIPGMVRTLNRHGYRSTAIHPNTGVFWNRNQAFQQIGFDKFIDDREFSKDSIVGLFISDAALTDRVLAELDDSGPPQMLFAITMQNHGPFDWRPGLDEKRLASLKMPPGLDDGGKYWLRNYLYMVEDADHELGRLADALQKRKRRTLLLFYGDHLPALPPVYHQIGFADGRGPKEQLVPWLLLDNGRKLRNSYADTPLTSWLLPSVLLETAGIGGDRYFATLEALRASLPLNAHAMAGDLPKAMRALGQLRYRGELDAVVDTALEPAESDWSSTIAP
jgi:phosphoglycerol transferase MdoB-like AlkP superfamily enzyme